MYSVLVVDDFAYDRQNLVNMVASFDDLPLCVVGMCENGYEALEAVHNLQPDVLICDVEMPGMNGIELANALREENNRAHIVFCSLYDKVHYLQAAIQLNCDGYLMKPVSRQELDVCLRQILLRLLERLKADAGITRLSQINGALAGGDPKKLPTYHQIILVKNQTGLKNLVNHIIKMRTAVLRHLPCRNKIRFFLFFRHYFTAFNDCSAGLFSANLGSVLGCSVDLG